MFLIIILIIIVVVMSLLPYQKDRAIPKCARQYNEQIESVVKPQYGTVLPYNSI
jgi:hypothetical protein